MNQDVTDRQRRILARLVSEYIEQGEPVSSAWLAAHSALGLSSATVRSILARLEEQGLVRQPHTSAGRVPTDSGYRLYVDAILGSRKRQRPLPDLEARLRRAGSVSGVLENASQELSRASHHAAFALSPASPSTRLRHIGFVNLDGGRVLIIVAATNGEVTHKVVQPHAACTDQLLLEAANFINAEFAGLTLHEVRTAVMERMRQERVLYDTLVERALDLANSALADAPPSETLYVQGTAYLVDGLVADSVDRERTLETVRALFHVIEERHRLIELLTQYIESNGLTVVIGSEHFLADFHPFSVVASTFNDGHHTGTVGVIGPTRMRYQRAISAVDGISQAMTRILDGQQSNVE